MLVISIIAILSVIGLGSYSTSVIKGRDTQRKSDLSQIRKALETFNSQFGMYPLSDITSHKIVGCMDSPAANPKDPTFLECPTTVNGAFKYYVNGQVEIPITKLPTDPQASQFYYYSSADGKSYALYAALENGQDKDIVKKKTDSTATTWLISCGAANCNYKINESGLDSIDTTQ
jgi:type II secretory pathway pseudopilin PulG